MKNAAFHGGLVRTFLSYSIFQVGAIGKANPRTTSCHSNHYTGPVNPSFETGNLDGWKILSGDAFGNASVDSALSYWGGSFNKVGNGFLWGFAQSGDPAVGEIRSSTLQASSVMSFLVGGGWDPVNLYVGLVRESDGSLCCKIT